MGTESKDLVSLNVSQELIKPVIEKQVQAAIMAQLGSAEDVIAKVVQLALHVKVNDEGNVSKDSYYNKYDFMEVLVGKKIREAATEAFQEWVKGNLDKVRAAVLKEMRKPSRQEALAAAFYDAIQDSISASWTMKCDVKFDRQER